MKKLVLILLAVFTVSVSSFAQDQNAKMKADVKTKVDNKVKAIDDAVKLTAEQKTQVEAILTEAMEEVTSKKGTFESKEAYREYRVERLELAFKAIKQKLNADQVRTLDRLAEEKGY
jgi:Spy/CpxP family protein refolding chaperone